MSTVSINPVKLVIGKARELIVLRSYTRTGLGVLIAPATAPDTVQIIEEVPIDPRRANLYLAPSVVTVAGVAGGDSDPQPGIWTPGIEGSEGYNLVCLFDGSALTFVEPPEGPPTPAPEASVNGVYRVIITFGNTIQEFSVRCSD